MVEVGSSNLPSPTKSLVTRLGYLDHMRDPGIDMLAGAIKTETPDQHRAVFIQIRWKETGRPHPGVFGAGLYKCRFNLTCSKLKT